MASYTVNIYNQTGGVQTYYIFNKEPVLTPKPSSEIWSNVFASEGAPDSGSASFSFNMKFSAVAGASSGAPGDKIYAHASELKPVTLGTGPPSNAPGTTKQFTVDKKVPKFVRPDPPATAQNGCFGIDTDASFTYPEAIQDNYLIGVGAGTTGPGTQGAMASWIPEPSKQYQIQPVVVFYVAAGSYVANQMVKYSSITTAKVQIDFSVMTTQTAYVLHQSDGVLVQIQKPPTA